MRLAAAPQRVKKRTDEWLTPKAIIDALGGADSFDLDPCASVVRPWPTARCHLTIEDDGLAREWSGRVWLNPPYNRVLLPKFLSRMAEHDQGTAFIFARTDTDAFQANVWRRATALLFLSGRTFFHYTDGRRAAHNGGAPTVLCAYGRMDAEILADCGVEGQFVPLRWETLHAGAAVSERWQDIVAAVLQKHGSVPLDVLYREVAQHARTRRSEHWRAKVRQTLQRGPFVPLGRGTWGLAEQVA